MTLVPASSRSADPSAAVDSVFGRIGTVVAVNGDYSGVVATHLTGAVAASRYVGGTASVAPSSGTFLAGDFVTTLTGHVYVCTVAGSPGTWVDAGSVGNLVTSVFGRAGVVTATSGDYTAAQVTGAATLASPTFTGTVIVPLAANVNSPPQLDQLSPLLTITSGALPTLQLVSGTGVQVSTARDVDSYTAITYNSLIATNATATIALSPDNTTYSTLAVITKPVGVAFAGEIGMEKVRVPAGWYLKVTVVQSVLGLTTYA